MTLPDELRRENAEVLNLVQAMIGLVPPNLRGVSLVCRDEGVHLYFLLEHDSEETREDIDDIVFELEALQGGFIDVDVSVLVSRDDSAFGDLQGRRVYGRKE
ncbi:MAG TPA: hypothetical protein VGQ36_16025 [Thermoanaerobaculia bacterium]|jgi:hypothetical protein|nr:hypothetical protein [Thermoanaerobaculia bacterium]